MKEQIEQKKIYKNASPSSIIDYLGKQKANDYIAPLRQKIVKKNHYFLNQL